MPRTDNINETLKIHDKFIVSLMADQRQPKSTLSACAAPYAKHKTSNRTRPPRKIHTCGIQESHTILSNLATGEWHDGTSSTKSGTKHTAPTATDEYEYELQQAWVDVSRGELEASKVRKARQEDVECIHTGR